MMMISYPDNQLDTILVCSRNPVADVTFYDSANVITTIVPGSVSRFPFIFIEKNSAREAEERATLVKQLRPGQIISDRPLNDDWVILIILTGALLYSLIKNTSKSLLPEISRFFLFRGVTDPVSRDMGGLFHWQSTIMNLVSFMTISLFAYCIAEINNLIPPGFNGLTLWLLLTAIIIIAITLRHIVCYITGNISGKRDEFHEYLLGIYQSYRFGALVLFIIVILLMYTTILPQRVSIYSGVLTLGLMYLLRILRLLVIFIKRNISIFYLILYLCALEILPVLISVKYLSGLV
jgi:hypothetical protein